MRVYKYIYIHIYIYTSVYIYIYIYTHTIYYSHTSEDYYKTEFQKQKLLAHSWVSPVHRRDDYLHMNAPIKQKIRVEIFPFHAYLIPTLFSFLLMQVFLKLRLIGKVEISLYGNTNMVTTCNLKLEVFRN